MLDETTRATILRLRDEGHGARAIARLLNVSRGAVKRVMRDGTRQVPALDRCEKAEPHRDLILALYASCKGNLVRVHEELLASDAKLSYQTLTAFCRRHSIGHAPPLPAGQYEFEPGKEMQHDTSPHLAKIALIMRPVVTASLVLCYSRMTFSQHYPRFTRFECKVFLTDALRYFDGAADSCMIDNTHVIVLSGSGKTMVPVPEMVAFGDRFGFGFRAHAIGNANRSAHVERRFDFIDNNFLAGREFRDWTHLNAEALAWCDRVNAAHRRHLHGSARELFAVEQPKLHRLPAFVPDVYALHQRIVDSEAYVSIHRNRYSIPWKLMGRFVEVRETKDQILVFDGPRLVAEHKKILDPIDARVTVPEHRPPRGERVFARTAARGERDRLAARLPALAPLLALLERRGRAGLREVRIVARMADDYPLEPFLAAVADAVHFGLTDLERLERMVLRRIGRDFFRTPYPEDGNDY